MIRRAVMVAAAAVTLTLVPSAAMAQAVASRAPAGVGSSVVDSSPSPGVPFTIRAAGASANESVTLRITRRPALNGNPPRSLTKSANARGVVEFVVTIAEDGTYTLVSTSARGSTLSRQSVTVVDQGAVIVAGEGAAAASAPAASVPAGTAPAGGVPAGPAAPAVAPRVGGRLASTGSQGLGLAGGGGVLVLAGAGLVAVARRRRTAQDLA